MRAKGETKEILCEHLQRHLDSFVAEAKEEIRRIKRSITVEEVMYHKQRLLYAYVNFLPIGSRHCYFCLQSGLPCPGEECSYALEHGVCKEDGSDYDELENAVASLENAIARYYQGEEYKEVKQRKKKGDKK